MAVTTSAEAVKSKYGGNFSVVGVFSVLGGNVCLAEAAKPKYGGNRYVTASAHKGGNFTAGRLPIITLVFSQ